MNMCFPGAAPAARGLAARRGDGGYAGGRGSLGRRGRREIEDRDRLLPRMCYGSECMGDAAEQGVHLSIGWSGRRVTGLAEPMSLDCPSVSMYNWVGVTRVRAGRAAEATG